MTYEKFELQLVHIIHDQRMIIKTYPNTTP